MNSRVIMKVHRKLKACYGPLPGFRRADPVDELINTILSQNTSDVNSGRAFAGLRRAFPRWDQVADADPRRIACAIRSGGLANIKSARIRNVLREIRRREGRISLGRLRKMPTPQALEYLLSFKGVGIKTACCVLLFSLDRPVMPVDTHVFRVAGRLGWLGRNAKIESANERLQALVSSRLMLSMHLYLIQHGRRTCRPSKPACAACCIAAHCRARDEFPPR